MLALAEAQRARDQHMEMGRCSLRRRARHRQDRGARRAASPGSPASGRPERVLVFASTRATAERLRARVESLLDGSYEELWIGTWDEIGERLLREHSDRRRPRPLLRRARPAPSAWRCCSTASTTCRCASHEIRGNPAGLLARLLERIDALKAGSDPPDPELRRALRRPRPHPRRGRQPRPWRPLPHPQQAASRAAPTSAADRRPLRPPDGRRARGHNRGSTGGPRRRWRTDNPQPAVCALEEGATSSPAGLLSRTRPDPASDAIVLEERFREPPVRFWRCAQRAGAGPGGGARGRAPARRRHVAGDDLRARSRIAAPDGGAGRGGDGGARHPVPHLRPGGAVPAARGARRDRLAASAGRPGRLGGGGAGADPAADRAALGRPGAADDDRPAAQASTWSPACEAALESPQIPPEARERIQAFLKLYGEASAAMEERRADVFVRRLIERVGLRRQRLFAAAAGGRRAAARPLPAGRAGRGLGAARAARRRPATSSAT